MVFVNNFSNRYKMFLMRADNLDMEEIWFRSSDYSFWGFVRGENNSITSGYFRGLQIFYNKYQSERDIEDLISEKVDEGYECIAIKM